MRVFGTIIPVTLAVAALLSAHALVVATPDNPVASVGLQSQAASVMTPWVEKISAELIPARLSDLPEVHTRLNQRASTVNWRASVGRVTAEDLYRKIPGGVRVAGGKAVLGFLDVHDVSHSQPLQPSLLGGLRYTDPSQKASSKVRRYRRRPPGVLGTRLESYIAPVPRTETRTAAGCCRDSVTRLHCESRRICPATHP